MSFKDTIPTRREFIRLLLRRWYAILLGTDDDHWSYTVTMTNPS